MKFLTRCHAMSLALLTAAACCLATAAPADNGSISFKVIKGGWVIGASGGTGTLFFHGQRYPLVIGGISYGLVFGGSETFFHGTVSHIRTASDVAGIYAAAGAGG